jgi:hypothetical protein
MVQLSPLDSSILTRVAKYRIIPVRERAALLVKASPEAKEIGEILLGIATGDSADEDIMSAVEAYRKSFPKDRPLRSRRRCRVCGK